MHERILLSSKSKRCKETENQKNKSVESTCKDAKGPKLPGGVIVRAHVIHESRHSISSLSSVFGIILLLFVGPRCSTMTKTTVAVLLLVHPTVIRAFVAPRTFCRQNCVQRNLVPTDFSSFLTAVEVFDGNQVIDPVVVSQTFWSSLGSRILSIIIGQALALLAFGILVTLASKQIGRFTEFVSKKVFREDPPKLKMPPNSTAAYAKQPDFAKLLLCLAIDVIGSSSELIPVLGELTDVVYAPVAGLLLRSLFAGSNVVFALEFAEEILPFTDILPLATICWVVDTFAADSDLAKLLRVGQYSNNAATDSSAIDVQSTTSKDAKRLKATSINRVDKGSR